MMPKENSKKTPVKSPPWVLAAGVGTEPEIPMRWEQASQSTTGCLPGPGWDSSAPVGGG